MENKTEFVKDFISEIWNQGNTEKIPYFINNFYQIFHDPGDPYDKKILTHKQFEKRLITSRKIRKDIFFQITNAIPSENSVTLTWTFTALYSNNNTNKKLNNISGITIYYLNDEKICGHWQEFDRLSLMNQISK